MSSSPSIESFEITDFTPAMRQFVEVKQKYPHTLVLFRMGDFYETFFDDAIKANRLIGITLTKRGKMKNGEPIPMAGIPAVSLDQYIARLVKLGESIVIAEQLGTPGKGLMERRISRIITPGTLTDASLLPEKDDAVLLSVAPLNSKAETWGLVWLTLSNGRFLANQIPAASLASELFRISPTEMLVPEKLKDQFREDYPELTITPMPEWHFDGEHGEEALKKLFNVDNLDAFGLKEAPAVLIAANALLDYTEETQVDIMPFIEPLKILHEEDFVVIDPASRRNLEISDSLRVETKGPTLFSILDHCQTGMGSRTLKRWLNEPLRDRALAESRHSAIEEFFSDSTLEDLRILLSRLPDIERIASRITLGSVRPKELAALRDALPTVKGIRALLAQLKSEWFHTQGDAIELPEELSEHLEAALLDEPATFLRDGDVIRAGFNAELDELRALRDNTGQFLMDLEAREKAATGLSTLRVEYNRVHGFFIEVSKGQAPDVPVHYHRRQTLKNVERFITPELKEYEDKAISAKERANDLEKALYDELIKVLNPYVAVLMQSAQAIAQSDALASLAMHAKEHQWVRPTLNNRIGIDIEAGRHPVVETTIETFVPNDCRLGAGRRCLMITGPNMGGKSTYMRSVALITLLAWAGAFVPAKSAVIGPIDRILTRIGASDDLARGRSTFMVEMTEAATILHQATERSLVLMDEIGRGTATFDGLSLAAAIAQELVEGTRSLTLFATHYFELTELAGHLKEVANVHVSATQSKKRIVFLHEISEGPANRSYGIAVAQLAGVPSHVVRRAEAYLSKLESREAENQTPQGSLFDDLGFLETQVAPETSSSVLPEAEDPFEEERRALVDTIAQIEIDDLSPREALAKLYELCNKAKTLSE